MSQTWFRSSPLGRLSARRAVTTAGKALTAACAIGLVAAIPAVQAPAHAAAASTPAVDTAAAAPPACPIAGIDRRAALPGHELLVRRARR